MRHAAARLIASRSVARWAPTALFVVVALFHLHQNRTAELNPWLGGGFGMFSTNDQPWPQSLSIEAEDANGKRYFAEWNPPWARPGEFLRRQALYAQPDPADLSMVAGYALQSRPTGKAGAVRQTLDTLARAGVLDRIALRESTDALSKTEIVQAQSEAGAASSLGIVHATARAWRLRFDTGAARFFTEAVGEPGEANRQP